MHPWPGVDKNKVSESIDLEDIRAQAAKVIASGVLGRSRFYVALLEFLVVCAEKSRTPKEIEVATEVFGRGSSFDPSQDSMVRVYAHNLRQKLQQFYTAGDGREEPRQLSIPRGEYRLVLLDREPRAEKVVPTPAPPPEIRQAARSTRSLALAGAAVLLIAGGIAIGMALESRVEQTATTPGSNDSIAASPLWRSLLDDDLPILVVVGDYFIFGELDAQGNVQRLVREFSINSSHDLDELFMYEPDLMQKYMDLDLTYLPRSAAAAMRNVLRVLYTSPKPVRTVSMSELNVADFKTNHVVYIGYISGLDKLQHFVFASSGLSVGDTFDELVLEATNKVYASGAGLPSHGKNYRDYGLFSTFPGPSDNQFVIIAGTRDAGLMQTAQFVTEPASLAAAEQEAAARDFGATGAVEILLEVTGFDRTSLNAMIVHSAALDYHEIWGGELVGSR